MDKQTALAQLKDIHLPGAVGWWPPAPGWLVLMAVLALFAAWIVWRTWAWWQALKPKRQALAILTTIERKANANVPAHEICAQVSQLLRRVALTYYPTDEVAGLKDEAWIDFLNQHGRQINFNAVREHILIYPYSKQPKANLSPLFERSRNWIKQRRQPWLK